MSVAAFARWAGRCFRLVEDLLIAGLTGGGGALILVSLDALQAWGQGPKLMV